MQNRAAIVAVFTTVMLLVPPSRLEAQSCPAADSAVGSVVAKKAYFPKYDDFTDTTMLRGKMHLHSPMMGDQAEFNLTTSFPGRSFGGSAATVLTMETHQMGEGGAIVGTPNKQQLSLANAKFTDVDAALLLVDDSVRVRLPRVAYKPQMKKAGALMPEMLFETLTFSVTPEQLAQIGRGSTVEIRVGGIKTKFGKGILESAREFARMYMCGRAAGS